MKEKIKIFFGAIYFRQLLNAMRDIRTMMFEITNLTLELKQIPLTVESLLEQVKITLEITNKSIAEVQKVPEIIGESLQKINAGIITINGNLKNIYKFSEGLKGNKEIKMNEQNMQGIEKPVHKITPKEFYDFCVTYLGTDVSLKNQHESTETINEIFEKLTGAPIGGEGSSSIMAWMLANDAKRFKEVDSPEAGDIIVSATGHAPDKQAIGDVGVVGLAGQVFCNNRENNKFDNHMTLETWANKYKKKSGFPIRFFRII